jgi:hypothetical protein
MNLLDMLVLLEIVGSRKSELFPVAKGKVKDCFGRLKTATLLKTPSQKLTEKEYQFSSCHWGEKNT